MKKFIWGIVGCMWSLPVLAGLYDVSGVAVDVEAENAVRAKEKALNDAVIQAFPLLIKKIGLDENLVVHVDVPQPPQEQAKEKQADEKQLSQEEQALPERVVVPENSVVVTPNEIASLVESVSVANERNTPVRYMADVTVHFKSKEIEKYLTERGIAFLDKEPPKMVIVPLWRENGMVLSFDENNPLFVLLTETPPITDLHTFVIPVGDDVDKSAIVPNVLNGLDYTALEMLRSKYRVQMVLIVDVTKENNIYTVKTIGYPSNPASGSDIAFAVSSRVSNLPVVMTHLMKKTTDSLVRQLKTYHLNHAMAGGKIAVVFDVVSLSEWNAIEKRLKAFNFVDKADVKALYKNKVFAELTFSENTQVALDKMAASGFMLISQDNVYVWQR